MLPPLLPARRVDVDRRGCRRGLDDDSSGGLFVVIDDVVARPQAVQVAEKVGIFKLVRVTKNVAEFLLGRRHLLAPDVEQRLDVVLDCVPSRLSSPVMDKN